MSNNEISNNNYTDTEMSNNEISNKENNLVPKPKRQKISHIPIINKLSLPNITRTFNNTNKKFNVNNQELINWVRNISINYNKEIKITMKIPRINLTVLEDQQRIEKMYLDHLLEYFEKVLEIDKIIIKNIKDTFISSQCIKFAVPYELKFMHTFFKNSEFEKVFWKKVNLKYNLSIIKQQIIEIAPKEKTIIETILNNPIREYENNNDKFQEEYNRILNLFKLFMKFLHFHKFYYYKMPIDNCSTLIFSYDLEFKNKYMIEKSDSMGYVEFYPSKIAIDSLSQYTIEQLIEFVKVRKREFNSKNKLQLIDTLIQWNKDTYPIIDSKHKKNKTKQSKLKKTNTKIKKSKLKKKYIKNEKVEYDKLTEKAKSAIDLINKNKFTKEWLIDENGNPTKNWTNIGMTKLDWSCIYIALNIGQYLYLKRATKQIIPSFKLKSKGAFYTKYILYYEYKKMEKQINRTNYSDDCTDINSDEEKEETLDSICRKTKGNKGKLIDVLAVGVGIDGDELLTKYINFVKTISNKQLLNHVCMKIDCTSSDYQDKIDSKTNIIEDELALFLYSFQSHFSVIEHKNGKYVFTHFILHNVIPNTKPPTLKGFEILKINENKYQCLDYLKGGKFLDKYGSIFQYNPTKSLYGDEYQYISKEDVKIELKSKSSNSLINTFLESCYSQSHLDTIINSSNYKNKFGHLNLTNKQKFLKYVSTKFKDKLMGKISKLSRPKTNYLVPNLNCWFNAKVPNYFFNSLYPKKNELFYSLRWMLMSVFHPKINRNSSDKEKLKLIVNVKTPSFQM